MKLMFCLLILLTPASAEELVQTIAGIKPSVVGIGSLQQTRGPAIGFVGTGFAVDDGLSVITAAGLSRPKRARSLAGYSATR